jgi:hypothetical protein
MLKDKLERLTSKNETLQESQKSWWALML